MKLFKISSIPENSFRAQNNGSCSCSENRCIWQCLPDPVVPVWSLISDPCGCMDCDPPVVDCNQNNITEVIPTPCFVFDNVYRSCYAGHDENGCVNIVPCFYEGCISPCTVDNPCVDTNPCCNMFLRCDSIPNSPTCGQCVREQDGEPVDCFNCPDCDSSMCDPTDPDPPSPPPPPGPPPPPPGPPSPPSPPSPPGPPTDPPCEKYVSGTLEYRDGSWICVDKISREVISAECCGDPPVTPTITVTDTTGPTSTPTTIGPTPTPQTNNPCDTINTLTQNIDNLSLFEQICNCRCYAKYSCLNGNCMQDPNGQHDSYLSCLDYLCGGGDCSTSFPEPTPLPHYPVCQEPLIIDQ